MYILIQTSLFEILSFYLTKISEIQSRKSLNEISEISENQLLFRRFEIISLFFFWRFLIIFN
jgi:hypothetical protein